MGSFSCDPLDLGAGEGGDDLIALGEGQDWRNEVQDHRPRRAEGICGPLSASVASFCFSHYLYLGFSLCLLAPVSLSRFLHSGHLREMSVRDKDTGKNPGRVGRKRGQGHKDS